MVVATGGFRDAALCLLEGAESAELQAISRVAEHRLARGIWTSPGAGDLRRALAAAQRLAILVSLWHTLLLLQASLPSDTVAVTYRGNALGRKSAQPQNTVLRADRARRSAVRNMDCSMH